MKDFATFELKHTPGPLRHNHGVERQISGPCLNKCPPLAKEIGMNKSGIEEVKTFAVDDIMK
jgi:hypothetical protein